MDLFPPIPPRGDAIAAHSSDGLDKQLQNKTNQGLPESPESQSANRIAGRVTIPLFRPALLKSALFSELTLLSHVKTMREAGTGTLASRVKRSPIGS